MKKLVTNNFIFKKINHKKLVTTSFVPKSIPTLSPSTTSTLEPIFATSYIRKTNPVVANIIDDRDDWYWLSWDITEYISDLREELYSINAQLISELYSIKDDVFSSYSGIYIKNLKYIEGLPPLTHININNIPYLKILWYDEPALINLDTGVVYSHYSHYIPKFELLDPGILEECTTDTYNRTTLYNKIMDIIVYPFTIVYNKLLNFNKSK